MDLTLRQALLIVDAVNGLPWQEPSQRANLLAREVEAVLALGAPEMWADDGRALLELIETWPAEVRLKVIDAAERFWATSDGGYEEALRAVGLLGT